MLRALAAVVALIVVAAPASEGMPTSATPDRAVQATAVNPWPGDIDPTSKLFGVIRDAKTGSPIGNACLDVTTPRVWNPRATTCTDANGAYELILPATTSSAAHVAVRAEGYPTRWLPNSIDWASGVVGVQKGVDRRFDVALGDEVGTFAGSAVRQDGSADPFTKVLLHRVGESAPMATIFGDANGLFSRAGIPAGKYQAQHVIYGYSPQWHPATTDRANAAIITIGSGQTVTVNEKARPSSTLPVQRSVAVPLTGQVTSGGAPVPHATIRVGHMQFGWDAEVTADAEGRYSVASLPYNYMPFVIATAPGKPAASIDGRVTPSMVGLKLAGPSVANFDLPTRFGAIRGRVVDYDETSLPGDTRVSLNRRNADGGLGAFVGASSPRLDGTYEFAGVPEGDYLLSVSARVTRWHGGSTTAQESSKVTVAHGQTVELTDTLPVPALLEVKTVDSVTGVPITGVCVNMGGLSGGGCTNTTGTFVGHGYGEFQPARVRVSTDGDQRYFGAQADVDVAPGQISRVTLKLRAGAVLKIPVTRPDGYPYAGSACVYAVRMPFVHPDQSAICGEVTDQVLTLGPLEPSVSRLLVIPAAYEAFGLQWLGATGGTGQIEKALSVELVAGKTTTTPTAKFDWGRMVSGDVIGGGRYLPNACVHIGLNVGIPALGTCANESGGFAIGKLGPYEWPVRFSANGYAQTWYGGTSSRNGSTMVDLRTRNGAVTMTLKREGFLKFDATTLGKVKMVTVFDAYTGDFIDHAAGSGPFKFGGMNSGRVIVQIETEDQKCWLNRRMRPFMLGTPYAVTTAGLEVNLAGVLSCSQQEPLFLQPGKPTPYLPRVIARGTGVTGKLRGHSR